MNRAMATLLLVFIAACGLPVDNAAKSVTKVPYELLEPQASAPAEPVVPAEGPAVRIYLIDPSGQQLVAADRRLAGAEVSLDAVLDALLNGPTRAERAQGLSTALNDAAAVGTAELVGGVASIDLTSQFVVLDGPTQRLAIAQIVLTLTGRPGVGRVSFTLDGQPIDIPRGDGTLATGSVSRDNYRELSPGG